MNAGRVTAATRKFSSEKEARRFYSEPLRHGIGVTV
jgi:hypothetical protein